MDSKNSICNHTSIKFNNNCNKTVLKLGKQHPLNKIKIKKNGKNQKQINQPFSKNQQVTCAQRILTQRVTTKGCGFYQTNYRKQQTHRLNPHNIDTTQDQSNDNKKIEGHSFQKRNQIRRNKSLDDKDVDQVKIALNYTNYYLCASNYKKGQLKINQSGLYYNSKLPQNLESKTGHFPKKSGSFNTAIYLMLRDYKRKIRRNSNIEQNEQAYPKIYFRDNNKMLQHDKDSNIIQIPTKNIKLSLKNKQKQQWNNQQSCSQQKSSFLLNSRKLSNDKKITLGSSPIKTKYNLGSKDQIIRQKIKRCFEIDEKKQRSISDARSHKQMNNESNKLFIIEKSLVFVARNAKNPGLPLLNTNFQHQKRVELVPNENCSDRSQNKISAKLNIGKFVRNVTLKNQQRSRINFTDKITKKRIYSQQEDMKRKGVSILSGWEINEPEDLNIPE